MDHISYSQYNTYVSCPRSWYLSKIRHAEEKQTWYIPIGSAVHNMIEEYLGTGSDSPLKAEDFFYPLIERQLKIEPDTSKWMAGGPKDAPVVEDKALQLVRDCFEKALYELDNIRIWEVEAELSFNLPGLEVPIKAFADILGEHYKKGPVILDWKTGSTKPGNFQLETYAALLKVNPIYHDLNENYKGRYVMLAPGKPVTRYVDLSDVSPVEVGAKYQQVYEKMQAKLYPVKQGFDCRFCFNQENCLANAGMTPRSIYYDKSEEDGIPF